MRETTAEAVADGFGAALRAGDALAATAFFSRDGCFVTPDKTIIHGRAQIRGFLEQLVALIADLSIEQQTMLVAGGVALRSEAWTMRVGAERHLQTTRSTLVMGQVEGHWRIAVADPWRER